MDALGLGSQRLPAAGLVGEQVAQVAMGDLGVMTLQRLPRLAPPERGSRHVALCCLLMVLGHVVAR